VDVQALGVLALGVKPKIISIGGSLNLFEHSVAEIRSIADAAGARVLFDAAHQCGLIAGNPLDHGAHVMTMSTYKSLGGPVGGLVLTNESDVAQRLDVIAFPGMTANFVATKSAALAISLLDWREHGAGYAASMVETAHALAIALVSEGIPVFRPQGIATTSHQFAIEATRYGGGQTAAKRWRAANLLACGIGLPIAAVADVLNGLRLGTPEIVRRGMRPGDMATLARLIARALHANNPEAVAVEVTDFRKSFKGFSFIR